MDTERSKELWDRLENEPERAYRAFEGYLSLPSSERTLIEAYRAHVGNPEAAKPSDTWSRWSSDFAWRERAAAYDDHIASLRRDAYERAIEEEAERQAREAEKTRGRMNELMTLGYERAMEWLEEVGATGMRAADVIQIMRLHLDVAKTFEVDRELIAGDTWTEEDDEYIETLIREIDAEADADEPGEGEEELDEGEGSQG